MVKIIIKNLFIGIILGALCSCAEKNKTSLGATSGFLPVGSGINFALNVRNAQFDLSSFFSSAVLGSDPDWGHVFNLDFTPHLELKKILASPELGALKNGRWKFKDQQGLLDISPDKGQFAFQYNNPNEYFIRAFKQGERVYLIFFQREDHKVQAFHFDRRIPEMAVIDEFYLGPSDGEILMKRFCREVKKNSEQCQRLFPYNPSKIPHLINVLLKNLEINETQFEVINLEDLYEKN